MTEGKDKEEIEAAVATASGAFENIAKGGTSDWKKKDDEKHSAYLKDMEERAVEREATGKYNAAQEKREAERFELMKKDIAERNAHRVRLEEAWANQTDAFHDIAKSIRESK